MRLRGGPASAAWSKRLALAAPGLGTRAVARESDQSLSALAWNTACVWTGKAACAWIALGPQRHIDPSEGLSQNVNRSEKQEKAKRAPEQAPTSGAEIIWAQISALAR